MPATYGTFRGIGERGLSPRQGRRWPLVASPLSRAPLCSVYPTLYGSPVEGQVSPSLTSQETFLLSGQGDVGSCVGHKETSVPREGWQKPGNSGDQGVGGHQYLSWVEPQGGRSLWRMGDSPSCTGGEGVEGSLEAHPGKCQGPQRASSSSKGFGYRRASEPMLPEGHAVEVSFRWATFGWEFGSS